MPIGRPSAGATTMSSNLGVLSRRIHVLGGSRTYAHETFEVVFLFKYIFSLPSHWKTASCMP